MSRLDQPVAHGEILAGLWRAAKTDRLPHALLFEGPGGIGKFMAARCFAAGMLCACGPGLSCAKCGSCRRIDSGGEESNHPDLLEIDPVSGGAEAVSIGHIAYRENVQMNERVSLRRTVEGFLDLKPQGDAGRVVILREADRLTSSAQNALLKTLEEPREGILLILVASRVGALLDTVISRVTRVAFARLDAEDSARIVQAMLPGLEQSAVRDLARWAGGSPGRALRLHEEGRAQMVALLDGLLSGKRGAISTSRELWLVEGGFSGKTERAKERHRSRAVLDLTLEIAADLGALEAGATVGDLVHGELITDAWSAGRGVAGQLAPVRERLLRARADIDANLTPGSVLDSALLALAKLAPRQV